MLSIENLLGVDQPPPVGWLESADPMGTVLNVVCDSDSDESGRPNVDEEDGGEDSVPLPGDRTGCTTGYTIC